MKKNLFEINTEEVQRILSLHEDRTKSQYLNIISEQEAKQEYKLSSKTYELTNASVISNGIVKNNLKLFKGATFTKKGNTVIANTSYQYVEWSGTVMVEPDSMEALQNENYTYKGTVTYYCSGTNAGKFITDRHPNSLFYDKQKVLSIELNQLCGGRLGKYTQQKSGSLTATNDKPLKVKSGGNIVTVLKGNDINYVNNKASVINNAGNAYIIFTCPNNFSVEPTYNRSAAVKGFPLDTYTLTFFQNNFCTGKPKEVKPDVAQPKSNFNALYTISYNHDLGKVKVNSQDIIIKSTKYPDYAAIMRGNTPIAYYNCKTNAWNDIQIADTKGTLTATIKEKVCPQVLTPTTATPDTSTQQGTNTQQGANTQQGVNPKTSQVNKQQQFVQRTVAGINSLQQNLGNTKPTGQLTTTDIDTLLSKLK